jgi:hypothetical protein
LYPLKGGACGENADEFRDRISLNTTVSQYPDSSKLDISYTSRKNRHDDCGYLPQPADGILVKFPT